MKNKRTSVFELFKIEYCDCYDDNGEDVAPQYPEFKVNQSRIGIFSTLEKAEQGIRNYIEQQKKLAEEHGDEYINDLFGYLIEEFELDQLSYYWKKSDRNYLPDGTFLSECLTSEMPFSDGDFERFLGRTADKVHYRNGDLVEILQFNSVMLGIVGNPPLSPERALRLPMLDSSDDVYYTLSVSEDDEQDTHSHEQPTRLFPARFPVSDELRSNLEKQYLRYWKVLDMF
jgi:hypothetical protein